MSSKGFPSLSNLWGQTLSHSQTPKSSTIEHPSAHLGNGFVDRGGTIVEMFIKD